MLNNRLLYGGDYNPEQWLDRPDILKEDIRMLMEAGCNTVTLGIFSWAALEPQEGDFRFQWLENIVDRLYKNGIYTIMGTPSGARPKWLADKYPEVLRVDETGHRQMFGFRHNHCYTSPVYREKTALINKKLAKSFGNHPGVILWHISNELGGECRCPLCQDAFRRWLKERYRTIDELNRRWCTTFWSHTYQSFEQIEAPFTIGETQLHALNLDWKRFVTHQTRDFLRHEIDALREGGAKQPTTTNLMHYYQGLDYFKLAKDIDLVSWDTYPTWHKGDVLQTAYDNGMCHDLMRSLKKKPYLQMESCPTSTNWQSVSKLKKPGMLFAQMMQAIAHGAEGAMYFQVRQSRGASEKFHGAVIDHYGGSDTRVFKEAKETGEALEKISGLLGSEVRSSVAILYDWESQWAMEDSQGPRNKGLHYMEVLLKFYRGFRRMGANVDLVDEEASLDGYRLLACPMVYMFKEGFAEKVRSFTENGGTVIFTYWSGIVDDTDRCYLGGVPYGLQDVLGLRSTEIDGLYDDEENSFIPVKDNALGLQKTYSCHYLCDLVQLHSASAMMTYGTDFYAGYPAVTVNSFGKGEAWYVAADADSNFYDDFLEKLVIRTKTAPVLQEVIPDGIEMTTRETENGCYYIYQNFGTTSLHIPMPEGELRTVYGNPTEKLPVYGMVIVYKEK